MSLLPLAAGESGERLAETEIAEPNVCEPAQDGVRGRRMRLPRPEELRGLCHGHSKDLADVAAAELVVQHGRLEPLSFALLADRLDGFHEAQLRVDNADAVADRAGALELAENRAGFTPLAFPNAVRIGSSSPVYVAGLLRREPRMGVWSIDTTPAPAGIDPWTSELLPEPATPVTTTSTPSGMSTSKMLRRLCACRATDLERSGGLAHALLEGGPVPEVAAGDRVAGPQPVDGALEADGPSRRSGAGAEVDYVVGDSDRLRLVLHDQHRVALVPQPQQEVVHPRDVVRVQADGGLVEDVGDVGQRRAEVANHLDSRASPPDRVPDGRSNER